MKRIISFLLSLILIMGLLPMSVSAVTVGEVEELVPSASLPYMNSFTGDYWSKEVRAPHNINFTWWNEENIVKNTFGVYYDPEDGHLYSYPGDSFKFTWRTSDLENDTCLNAIKDAAWAQEVADAILEGYYDVYIHNNNMTMQELTSTKNTGYLCSSTIYAAWSTLSDSPPDVIGDNKDACLKMLVWRMGNVEEMGLREALLSYFWVCGMDAVNEPDGVELLNSAREALTRLGYLDETALDESTYYDKLEQLGTYPATKSFKERAIWSAKASVVYQHIGVDIAPTVTQQDVLNNQELPTLDKYIIASAYDIYACNPASALKGHISLERDSAPAIDTATASYALSAYNSLAATNALNTRYLCMEAFIYKLQATMGLASGVLDSTTQEVASFKNAAYGTALDNIRTLLYADIISVNSKHLGNEVDTEWLYYLLLCYNEFAAYGELLTKTLATAIVEGRTYFSGYEKDLSALKALYAAASWVDDTAIWELWTTTSDDGYSLKSIYDYLLSVSAFDAIEGYEPGNVDSPLRYFFGTDGTSWQLSSDLRTGIVASSSFLPMKTNLYDPYTFSGIVDTSWLVNFHSKFGYNRKALYIDSNVDAAVNFQRTGTRGELKVCTLEDLLEADKDIVLYLDDNLYNVNTLAELTDKAFNRLDNVDEESTNRFLWQKIGDAIISIWDISMESIAKTAEVTTYSSKVQSSVAKSDTLFGSTTWSDYFFDTDQASSYLKPDDLWDDATGTVYTEGEEHTASSYTPLTAFAVLSSIYRDDELFNSLNTVLNKNTPVFISSPSMPYVSNASKDERQSIYNYLLLKNLDSQMSVDYATNLDMTSPVYMDIYGNIITESGLVVVPAAANATLWNSSYSPYNAAFFSTYGDDFLLKCDKNATELNKVFDNILVEKDGYWQLSRVNVVGGDIDLSRLSTADKDSLAAITEIFRSDLSHPQGIYSKSLWQMIVTEVLRGAPIEHIDKEFEGLNLNHRVTKNGLMVAEKLEFLVDALSSGGMNTTLSIPNPAFMDGIEYIVFFIFKLLVLAVLVIWMFTIYVDAVGGEGINYRTFGKCVLAVVLVLSLVLGIPAAFELSYYQSNRLLLQDETEYLMMLNLEKSESGQEIGITSVHEPDTNTTLYLKLADVDIPWYDLLPKIAMSSTVSSLHELYAEYEGQHPVAGVDGVTVINDGAYISTDELFSSTSISFSPTLQTLWHQASDDTPASYYTPYYYFLEQLINKANTWTISNNYYAYTTKVQRGGKLKTLGYVQPYLTSEQFMQEGMDYFGLYTLYDVTAPMVYTDELLIVGSQLESTRTSQWCNMDMSDNAKIQRIERLNQYAREWVAKNKELLGKVTDETFLKCMALSCALEHNRLFNTLRADSLEIYELSNEDLMRLSIADRNTVMNSSTMSYARFVFSVGGTPAVFAAALLTMVNFFSSLLKPIATIMVFLLTIISVFINKLLLRKSNRSFYGYICTILLMCSVNVLGSLFLKLSMYIPNFGLSPTVCILVQVFVQSAYMYLLFWIVEVAAKDWRNMGYGRYNVEFNKLTHHQEYSVEVDTPKQKNGWDYYNMLVERQRRRHVLR